MEYSVCHRICQWQSKIMHCEKRSADNVSCFHLPLHCRSVFLSVTQSPAGVQQPVKTFLVALVNAQHLLQILVQAAVWPIRKIRKGFAADCVISIHSFSQ